MFHACTRSLSLFLVTRRVICCQASIMPYVTSSSFCPAHVAALLDSGCYGIECVDGSGRILNPPFWRHPSSRPIPTLSLSTHTMTLPG